MKPKKMFQEILIVRDTGAVAFQPATCLRYDATLEKGRVFRSVTGMQDGDDVAVFSDAASGMCWAVPSEAVFPLDGRFDRSPSSSC